MQSLVMRAFTNYRASGDYAGTGNFDIGGSSLLGWALGPSLPSRVPVGTLLYGKKGY